MAKDKVRVLGTVVKVYDSNIVETDSGNKVTGKFEKGSILVMDLTTKEISVQEKKTAGKQNKNTPDVSADNSNENDTGANALENQGTGESN